MHIFISSVFTFVDLRNNKYFMLIFGRNLNKPNIKYKSYSKSTKIDVLKQKYAYVTTLFIIYSIYW